MIISNDIKYIGVNDRKIDLFEGQYAVTNGMSYNSYVITDEKIAVIDTVDARFSDEWLKKLKAELKSREPDFLVVQHMEPDHSGALISFMNEYPGVKIVATSKAFVIIKQFFGTDFADNQIVVNDNTVLDLGRHSLSFVAAPMVHWPEVMVSFDSADNVLFSADAFGKFGDLDAKDVWADEARRYYIGIVGKYGAQVQSLLKKAAALNIQTICPLHGPCLSGDSLTEALRLYDIWSSYKPEKDGTLIAFTSIYGHTKEAAEFMYNELLKCNKDAVIVDLARSDLSECVAKAFSYKNLVLATPTYNSDVFPFMRNFIEHLTERKFQNRKIVLIENGSWAPVAANVMKKMLEKSNNLTFCEPTVTIRGSYNDESKRIISEIAQDL